MSEIKLFEFLTIYSFVFYTWFIKSTTSKMLKEKKLLKAFFPFLLKLGF
jgi:hypothetical protein